MRASVLETPKDVINNGLLGNLSQRIWVKAQGRLVLIESQSIYWIESAGNYVQIKLRGHSVEEYLVRGTLQSFENQLDARYFVRIHRSVIVNCRRIRELKPWFTGEYVVTLDNGKELTLSRKYRGSLGRLLEMGGVS